MIRSHFFTLLAALVLMAMPAGLSAQVEVTNVTASQRQDGSAIVDVQYTLSGATEPVTIWMRVRSGDGEPWEAPWQEVASVTGAVGEGVPNGTHSIVWDAKADIPDILWPDAQIEVTAWDVEKITVMLPGNVPLVMVRIPAGSFVMGSPTDERSRSSNEGPQTNVTLTQDFYMGKYPVTQAQWTAVMGSNPSHFSDRPNNPVESVSWNAVQNFITALNTHITATGQGPATVRLPTEAEWEYAARAGTTTRFYFGDSLSVGDNCQDDGLRSQHMWYCGNANGQTQPVGQKFANAFGLYDMHGNVSEWCHDLFSASLPGGSVTDPTGGTSGSNRVRRGGSMFSDAEAARSSHRTWHTQGGSQSNFGFRLVSTVSSSSPPPTVTITVPSSNQTVSNATSSFPFSGTALAPNSSVSLVQWRRNGGGWEAASGTTSWSFTVTGLVVGPNLIEVRATNAEGTQSALVSRTIEVVTGSGNAQSQMLDDFEAEVLIGAGGWQLQGFQGETAFHLTTDGADGSSASMRLTDDGFSFFIFRVFEDIVAAGEGGIYRLTFYYKSDVDNAVTNQMMRNFSIQANTVPVGSVTGSPAGTVTYWTLFESESFTLDVGEDLEVRFVAGNGGVGTPYHILIDQLFLEKLDAESITTTANPINGDWLDGDATIIWEDDGA